MKPVDTIRYWRDVVAAWPHSRFDRIAAHDMELFTGIPSRVAEPGDYSPLFGVHVIVDDTVAPGVLELRHGDKVVDRIVIDPPANPPPAKPDDRSQAFEQARGDAA